MVGDLNPAISFLQSKLDETERNANELRGALNVLRKEAGLAPVNGTSAVTQGASSVVASVTTITDDTFYGKRQQTAIREYLEMRKSAGLGPAKPREIFDALKQGGYEYEAKSDDIALVGLRALLRKRSHVFHKLPNGAYGMMSWYPHAKATKTPTIISAQQVDADDDDDEDSDAAASKDSDDAADA